MKLALPSKKQIAIGGIVALVIWWLWPRGSSGGGSVAPTANTSQPVSSSPAFLRWQPDSADPRQIKVGLAVLTMPDGQSYSLTGATLDQWYASIESGLRQARSLTSALVVERFVNTDGEFALSNDFVNHITSIAQNAGLSVSWRATTELA